MKVKISVLSQLIFTTSLLSLSTAHASDVDEPNMNHWTIHMSQQNVVAKKFAEDAQKGETNTKDDLELFSEKVHAFITPEFIRTPQRKTRSAQKTLVQLISPRYSDLSECMQINTKALFAAYEAHLQGNAYMIKLAGQGSFSAMRDLAQHSATHSDSIKWVMVEMLASFGGSINFDQLQKSAPHISKAQVPEIMKEAAVWLRSSYYKNQELLPLFETQDLLSTSTEEYSAEEFSAHFIDSFSQGDITKFYNAVPSNTTLGEAQFMNFFHHMGITSEVDYELAIGSLTKAATYRFAPAREIQALINFLCHTKRSALRLEELAKDSSRVQWRNVAASLNKDPLEYVEPVNSLHDALKDLANVLKVNPVRMSSDN
jgi:hypothetical protein